MIPTSRPSRRGRPPARAKRSPALTAAQARALRAMASAPGEPLRGISWTTVRALRALGLCEIGPGRHGRLTGQGRTALDALAAIAGDAASKPEPPRDSVP